MNNLNKKRRSVKLRSKLSLTNSNLYCGKNNHNDNSLGRTKPICNNIVKNLEERYKNYNMGFDLIKKLGMNNINKGLGLNEDGILNPIKLKTDINVIHNTKKTRKKKKNI